jgi:hypothetical protein
MNDTTADADVDCGLCSIYLNHRVIPLIERHDMDLGNVLKANKAVCISFMQELVKLMLMDQHVKLYDEGPQAMEISRIGGQRDFAPCKSPGTSALGEAQTLLAAPLPEGTGILYSTKNKASKLNLHSALSKKSLQPTSRQDPKPETWFTKFQIFHGPTLQASQQATNGGNASSQGETEVHGDEFRSLDPAEERANRLMVLASLSGITLSPNWEELSSAFTRAKLQDYARRFTSYTIKNLAPSQFLGRSALSARLIEEIGNFCTSAFTRGMGSEKRVGLLISIDSTHARQPVCTEHSEPWCTRTELYNGLCMNSSLYFRLLSFGKADEPPDTPQSTPRYPFASNVAVVMPMIRMFDTDPTRHCAVTIIAAADRKKDDHFPWITILKAARDEELHSLLVPDCICSMNDSVQIAQLDEARAKVAEGDLKEIVIICDAARSANLRAKVG